MKKLTSILLILALVFSLAACSQTKQPDVNGDSSVSTSGDNTSPIPIAFIGSMTGLDEIYGYVSYSAAKMAVEQINEAGGVAGRQIELKCYDDRAEGIEAVNCARKAILDDGCVAILTASSTAGLISINAVLEEFEVPCIAYAIGAELVTHDEQGNTRPYMFRVNTTAYTRRMFWGIGKRPFSMILPIPLVLTELHISRKDLSRRVARSRR